MDKTNCIDLIEVTPNFFAVMARAAELTAKADDLILIAQEADAAFYRCSSAKDREEQAARCHDALARLRDVRAEQAGLVGRL